MREKFPNSMQDPKYINQSLPHIGMSLFRYIKHTLSG